MQDALDFKHSPADAVLLSKRHTRTAHITRLCARTSSVCAVGALDAHLALHRVLDAGQRRVLFNLLRHQVPERGVERCARRPRHRRPVRITRVVFELERRSDCGEVRE